MLGTNEISCESERRGYGVRSHSDEARDHNADLSDNLSTKSKLSTRCVDRKEVGNNGDPPQEPFHKEVDEEREALIAGFKEHLQRNNLEEGNLTRERQDIKLENNSQEESIESKPLGDNKCDQELILANTSETNSYGCNPDSIKNETMKNCDQRRNASAAMDSGKNTAKHAVNYKKTYLFLYNLTMFIMFLMVNLILSIETLSKKMDDDSVRGAASIIRLLTYAQLLESIHPILGLVPGGPFMPFLQVFGRLLVNHFLTDPHIRVNCFPYAHYLFIVWSSIEIFRYSFYALRVFNVEIYPITWARYTLFMPLYPMGGFCEAQILIATAKQLDKTGAYKIELPNLANFSFSLPILLRVYTFALLGPSILYLMNYMWSQRRKHLKVKAD